MRYTPLRRVSRVSACLVTTGALGEHVRFGAG